MNYWGADFTIFRRFNLLGVWLKMSYLIEYWKLIQLVMHSYESILHQFVENVKCLKELGPDVWSYCTLLGLLRNSPKKGIFIFFFIIYSRPITFEIKTHIRLHKIWKYLPTKTCVRHSTDIFFFCEVYNFLSYCSLSFTNAILFVYVK